MKRRAFLWTLGAGATLFGNKRSVAFNSPSEETPEVAITLDDPNVKPQPLHSQQECSAMLMSTLARHKLTATLNVCGKRIESPEGKALVKAWDDGGHLICNHTYSHGSYNYPTVTLERMRDDILRGEALIKDYKHFTKFLRFPYLKEGDTAPKRDSMREWMHSTGYKNGYVTIDGSDWYIDDRLKTKLSTNPKADLSPYRQYYLDHLWDRSTFYNNLAKEVTGRQIKHTILLHHTLTNALFLNDLIEMYRSKGWRVVDATRAYSDPVFSREPKSLPAGESLVWALAKETGRYDNLLRYPGEDDTYEKPKMDLLGL